MSERKRRARMRRGGSRPAEQAEAPIPTPAPSPPAAAPVATATRAAPSEGDGQPTWVRVGRYAWATVGIVAVLVILGYAMGRVSLLVIPLVLALFPAALLMPVASWLKKVHVPAPLAAILTMLGTVALIAGLVAALAPIVSNELPALVDSFEEGVGQLEDWLANDPLGLGLEFEGFADLLEQGRDQLGGLVEGMGAGVAGGALTAATAVVEGLTSTLLLLVALFFYLKDDGNLGRGVIRTMPRGWQRHATALADRFWATTGSYFRGQLLVALFDAVFIGVGLLILGIPLAIPLAVLVFFGGLFPVIGAFLSGTVAVLVALADAGPFRALLVLGLILLVQQAEGNILQPLILAKVIRLHPLVVIISIAAGGVLLGVLGAFLAVPVTASIARAIDYVRGEEHAEAVEDTAEHPDELVDEDAEG